MGNSNAAERPITRVGEACANLTAFYRHGTWIEGRALDQINSVRCLSGMTDVVAFPDLHPGRNGPVGMTARSEMLHPLLVGNDIGCGMSLFRTSLPVRKIKMDKAAERLRRLEGEWYGDPGERLAEAGLSPHCFPFCLGSIGGGNHFCEIQSVDHMLSPTGFDADHAYVLVHSGSRGFGELVLSEVPDGMGTCMDPTSPQARIYLAGHDAAVKWASLNRRVIAERAVEALRCDLELVCDVPHNLVVSDGEGWIHYKGAARPLPGEMAPVAGSRATLSYVVKAAKDMSRSLGGMSHGAGRKYDRASMHHRVGATRSARMAMQRNPWGGHIVCEDRELLLEEAPEAYKDAGKVVEDLVSHGLVTPIAAMRPIITFKRARDRQADGRGNR